VPLVLRTAYWHDTRARAAFKDLIRDVFGLDFSAWDAAGYWDEAYVPFTLFDGERAVASVCMYLMDAVVDGRPHPLVQVSGVATRLEWRRRGLSRQLLEAGLGWARQRTRGSFLFADDEAVSLYRRVGFAACEEYVESIAAPPVLHRPGARRLDMDAAHDRDLLYALAQRRDVVSDRFGVRNARLLMFHAMYRVRDGVWVVPALDCAVLFRRQAGVLHVYDIVAERMPHWSALYPYLADANDRQVEFNFATDKLGLEGVERQPLMGNNCHVGDGFPLAAPVFPFTARA